MNPMHQMKDPAGGVPPQLLPHMHLVSKHRYPLANNPSLENIVGYLLDAPKVMHEIQPVQWQILDCPADGTMLLTWQPQELGTNFASDGYVFQEHEQVFNSDVRGYNLQMYLYRSGFRPGVDTVASHSRRRYRLIPSQANMGGPMPDPSIWLIHYSKAATRDHVPAASIPVMPQVHAQLQQRRMLSNQGALARKEFMLRDRANWPTINPPGGFARQGSAGQVPQTIHKRGASVGVPEPTIEEEEDVSRGDALDFMTPRDISRMRYEQHHEWMEEILESPYNTLQIVPPELGLGRKGELESLTRDFFGAPVSVQESTTNGHPARVGRLEPGKAEEFTKLAEQRLADMQAELEKMKQVHQKRMDKLRKVSLLSTAEKRLRNVTNEAGRQKSISTGPTSAATSDALEDIVSEVESAMGQKVERVQGVACVAKGGYQEQFVPPNLDRAQSSVSSAKGNIDASGLSASMQQQRPEVASQQTQQQVTHTVQNGLSSTANDNSTTSPPVQDAQQLKDASDQNMQDSTNTSDHVDDDVNMEGGDEQPQESHGGDAGDWVMVDDQDLGNLGSTPGMEGGQHNQTPGSGLGATSPTQQTSLPPSLSAQHQDQQPAGQTPIDTGDFDLGNDFDNVNTAGDALADYNTDDLNLDNMDDSAFGDAFHHQDDDDVA